MSRAAATVPAVLLMGVLGGCAAFTDPRTDPRAETGPATYGRDDPRGASDKSEAAGVLDVVTALYPLQFAVEQVGGPRVRVTNLTPPGGEPHDLEVTPRDVATLASADLVVYLSGLQPAIDTAVQTEASRAAMDVGDAASLVPVAALAAGAKTGGADERAVRDPHFWLDPLRFADVAGAIGERLTDLDPAGAEEYASRRSALQRELSDLDESLRTGLTSCRGSVLVTSHEAFGYLAQRYGLKQVGISGLTPHAEPAAADLAAAAQFVRSHRVRTIYHERLTSPAVAETIAAETGAASAVLDPIEGLGPDEDGDYFSLMRANLNTLRAGQPCP